MDTINELINFMITVSVLGCTMRLIYCLIRIFTAEDGQDYKKKAVNAVIYAAVASAVWTINAVLRAYFT